MNQRLASNDISLTFMPHQIATADWALKTLENHKIALVFHKPGTGKTMIGIILAIVLAKAGKQVIITAPNRGILSIWETTLYKNTDSIISVKFLTKNGLLGMLTNIVEGQQVEDLSNTYIIIDEAHEILGISISDMLISLNIKTILLTGTPIINTPKTLTKLLELLTGSKKFDNAVTSASQVFDIKLKPEWRESIINDIRGLVSYLDERDNSISKGVYHNLMIKMDPVQDRIFQEARKSTSNEMFQQVLSNISLFALPKFNRSEDVANLENNKEIDGLTYKNGVFIGPQISSSLKAHSVKLNVLKQDHLASKGKMFIYLSNPGFGIVFLKSFFHSLQIEEYESTTFFPDPMCYCGKQRSKHYIDSTPLGGYSMDIFLCDDGQTFSPMRYIILSSISNLDPFLAIEAYNKPSNDTGREIKIIIGSDIIAVGYTITEVTSIHILSLPSNKGEEEQIIKRVLRLKAHKTPSTVNIYRYIAVPREGEGFDEKKLHYIKQKSDNTEEVNELLVQSSVMIDDRPHALLVPFLTREIVRPPSITKSLKDPIFKELGFKPDESVLNEFIARGNQIISRDKSEDITIPTQDYIISTRIVFSPKNYSIDDFLIIKKRNIYYHTTDFKNMRNLASMSKEVLLELYKQYSFKVHGSIKTLEYDIKEQIIDAIVSTVLGTKYLIKN